MPTEDDRVVWTRLELAEGKKRIGLKMKSLGGELESRGQGRGAQRKVDIGEQADRSAHLLGLAPQVRRRCELLAKSASESGLSAV